MPVMVLGNVQRFIEMKYSQNENIRALKDIYTIKRDGKGQNKDRRKDYLFRYKYGITLKDFQKILDKQSNRCAICKKALSKTRRKKNSPHVDHCHKTGKVRGILCSMCNSAIGLLKDDLLVIKSAARYLKKHSSAK